MSESMDVDASFDNIRENIKEGRMELVLPEVKQIVEFTDDLGVHIKCAALLKVVEEESFCQEILNNIMKNLPEAEDEKYQVAISMRGIGRFDDAYDIMSSLKTYVPDPYEYALCMSLVEENENALDLLLKSDLNIQRNRLLLSDVYCALGEFTKAKEVSESALNDFGTSYDTLVSVCNVMFKSGDAKGALKFAKSYLKEDKSNIDTLALNAYVMRINGRLPAAANYANRVLKADFKHIGALETLAQCLIEKGSYINAKLLAGAINDADPGNPAAVRILDECRQMSS